VKRKVCSGYLDVPGLWVDAAGLTPARMAGIPLDLTGNRWMTMIELASSK